MGLIIHGIQIQAKNRKETTKMTLWMENIMNIILITKKAKNMSMMRKGTLSEK